MYDDEKWLRSGDRRFTKTKRSSRDVIDQNEIQTYASLENMLHKAIHAVRQLKKKGNTYTSSAPKQQCKSSYLSNSDLKTNKISFNKSKAVKSISKVFSTRCFKCHRVGHYAKHKPLVTLENVETEPEKELISTKVRSSDHTDQTDRAVPRTSRLKLRQEPRPDDQIPRTGACLSLTVLHSKINGQDKTEFERVDFKIDRATSSLASLDCTGSHTGPVVSLRSWYIKSHSASLDDPFIPFQFQKCHRLLGSYQTPGQSHPSRFGRINLVSEPLWLVVSLRSWYIKSHSASLDDPFIPFQFQKFIAFSVHIKHPAKAILPILGVSTWYQSHFGWMIGLHGKSNLASTPQQDVFYPLRIAFEKKIQTIFGDKKQFVSNGFDVVYKRRKKQNMYDDEKWLRSGDRPFTKTKRSSRDVIDQNEIQTYASLEKMLHKAIHAFRQLKKKGNIYTSSAPKQQ
ncbi:hypothetical protein F2Q70_00020312 [Brassica cretica]|uniref:Uncharacterized protein n=1 Tax=Brassica cretica TaxID=69181 RepID=A0A8S9GTE6_BRACR|nr:hypothetical protein F2Q70_00020312 [Brassica cretica]